jgi:hypothetical protein
MKARTAAVLVLLIALSSISALTLSQPAAAQPTQVTNNISLTHLNVQLTYPSEINPGQAFTVNVQADAKNTFTLQSLTLQIYYGDGTKLQSITTATVASNMNMNNGNKINKDIQATVPAEALRTSLIAYVSESVKTASTAYSSNYYYSYYPYDYYNPNYTNSCYDYYSCYYSSYPYYSSYYYPYYSYPSYSTYYTSSTDSGLGSLSYINATTPEYISLQSQYQALQQQLSQSQSQNQQLQQNLQNAQNQVSQKDATISDLNNQLASTHNNILTFEIASGVLGAIAIILAIGLVLKGRGNTPKKTEQSGDPYAKRPEQ